MTVIVWDGKTMAADRMLSFGSVHLIATKIHKSHGYLFGASGDSDHSAEIIAWFRDHLAGVERSYPTDLDCTMLAVSPSGEAMIFCRKEFPIFVSAPVAIGSGVEVALTAMKLGKTAKEAAQIACELCPTCGCGVDAIDLEGDS